MIKQLVFNEAPELFDSYGTGDYENEAILQGTIKEFVDQGIYPICTGLDKFKLIASEFGDREIIADYGEDGDKKFIFGMPFIKCTSEEAQNIEMLSGYALRFENERDDGYCEFEDE